MTKNALKKRKMRKNAEKKVTIAKNNNISGYILKTQKITKWRGQRKGRNAKYKRETCDFERRILSDWIHAPIRKNRTLVIIKDRV